MIDWNTLITQYIFLVKTYPILSSAVQFAILGTIGELIATKIIRKNWYFFTPSILLQKIALWAFLGITFKFAFVGFNGFTETITNAGIWPNLANTNIWFKSFSTSLFLNITFGPMMVLFHRLCDNYIVHKRINFASLEQEWFTRIWFWLPVHTITFVLPKEFQIGLAAIWAIALGIILGLFAKPK